MSRNYCVCGKEAGFSRVTGEPYKLCKKCYKLVTSKGNKKKRGTNNKRKVVVTKRIDINSLHNRLTDAIGKRIQWQEKQDELWKYIKRTNNDRRTEMSKIDSEIGKNTYEINTILNELTKYKKTHNAMNIANNYLNSEIERTNKIIDKWENTVDDVERGNMILIKADGTEDTNTKSSIRYIKKKRRQLNNYIKWRDYVKRYLV